VTQWYEAFFVTRVALDWEASGGACNFLWETPVKQT